MEVIAADVQPAATKADLLSATDAKGRKLTFKPIDPLEEYRLSGMMGAKTASDRALEIASVACGVRSIDGEMQPFPNSERELQARIQILGADGFGAIYKAAEALVSVQDDRPAPSGDIAAKN